MPLVRLELATATIVRADTVDVPAEARASEGAGAAGWEPTFLAAARVSVGEGSQDDGEPTPDTGARAVEAFRQLITALRLFQAGGVGLGPYAWTHAGANRWRRIATGAGRPRRGGYRLAEEGLGDLTTLSRVLAYRSTPFGRPGQHRPGIAGAPAPPQCAVARDSAPAMPGRCCPGPRTGSSGRRARAEQGRAGHPSPPRRGGSPRLGRPAPVAIRRQRLAPGMRPGIRPQSDAAGLKEAKRGDQLAEGLDGAGAGVRQWAPRLLAPLADAHPRRREEGGLPARGARPLRGPRLGGHVDGVGANDRRRRKLQSDQRHLQPSQRDDHLDLVFWGLAPGLELGDASPSRLPSSEKSVESVHRRHRKTTPASSARLRASGGTLIPNSLRYGPASSADSIAAQADPNESSSNSVGAWSRTKRSVSGMYRGSGEPLPGSCTS